jgi:hypothetical protein
MLAAAVEHRGRQSISRKEVHTMKARQAVLGSLAAAVTLMVLALAFVAPAAADAPTEITFEVVFDDVNPCTGDVHTVTIAGTTTVHDHDGRIVAYSKRTITTSPTGFVGRGTDTSVLNDRVEMFRQTDILRSPSGDRMRAVFVIVFDLSTGTARVVTGGLACLGRA